MSGRSWADALQMLVLALPGVPYTVSSSDTAPTPRTLPPPPPRRPAGPQRPQLPFLQGAEGARFPARDHQIVFDADSTPPRKVEAGLHGYNHARFEHLLGRPAQGRTLVHLQPQTVPGAVQESLLEPCGGEHPPRRR